MHLQATLACKEWAHLAFEETIPRDKFGVANNGEELYEAFFLYYFKLSRVNHKEAEEYRCHLVRNGIGVIESDGARPDAQRPTQGRGGKAKSKSRRGQRSSCLQRVSPPNEDCETDNHHSYQGSFAF